MGKLNFRGYLISRFYPTREIRENLMHAKNMCFTVYSDWNICVLCVHISMNPTCYTVSQSAPTSYHQKYVYTGTENRGSDV